MNFLIKIFLVVSSLFIILPFTLCFAVRLIPANYQPSLDYPQKVFKDITVTQSFIASKDNLSAIGVSIKNPNLLNKKDISLTLRGEEGETRIVTLNGGSIEDGGFVKFFFDPISSSKNKHYIFQFSSPNSDKEESLQVFITNQKVNDQELVIGGEKRQGAVSFVDFYKPVSVISSPVMVYEEMINRLLADTPFVIFYFSVFLSLVLGILYFSLDKER